MHKRIYQKNDFYDYFKQLSSEIAENNPEEVLNFMQKTANGNLLLVN